MREVVHLIEELKGADRGVILLDALYQWVDNPTRSTAISRGVPPNHSLIKSNLIIRYRLTKEEAEEIYAKLKTAIEKAGYDFRTGFVSVKDEFKEYFEKSGIYEILRNKTLERLKNATEEGKLGVWLFCKLWIGSGEYQTVIMEHEKINFYKKFSTLFTTTFNRKLSLKEDELIEFLVKIGFLNELEWVRSNAETFSHDLNFPEYLKPVAEKIDNYIELPEPPEFKNYIDSIFEDRKIVDLVVLDKIFSDDKYCAPITEVYSIFNPTPGITGKYEKIYGNDYFEGYACVNVRIFEEMREYFYNKKNEAVDSLINTVGVRIHKALKALSDKYYPNLSCIEKAPGREWEINSLDSSLLDKDMLVIITPWLSVEELKDLYIEADRRYVVLITNVMGIPEFNVLLKVIYDVSVTKYPKNFIILDYSRGKPHEFVFNEKPRILDEIFAIGTKNESNIKEYKHDRHVTKQNIKSETKVSHKFNRKTNDYERWLRVYLGKKEDGEGIFWEPGKLNNGHFIIVGSSGAGKTETIKCIATELDKQGYPVLMIDFHGDMACQNCNIKSYEIKEGSRYYFNPLELNPKFEDITPLRASSDFVDALSINFPNMGVKQRDSIKEIIRDSYIEAGITNEKHTWNRELKFDTLKDRIKSSNIMHFMRDIFDYGLFSGTEKISIAEILNDGITHINLRALPESLKFLFADLFLRKLYYSLQALGEIPSGDVSDKDKFRLFVIVDEAKLLVCEKQGIKAVLNKYATEMRKFGTGLILASQLIEHFSHEILANVAVKFCMKAENVEEARKNSKFFGTDEKSLVGLKPGEGILIMGNKKMKIRITPSWKR